MISKHAESRPSLNEFYFSAFSQWGEEGVICEVMRRLDIHTGVAVEFGAKDGVVLSNSHLLLRLGWRGIYIDIDRQCIEDLESNLGKLELDFDARCGRVTVEPDASIDRWLKSEFSLKTDPTYMSIDIDGLDWWVWRSIREYRPLVLTIEYNTNPPRQSVVGIDYDKDYMFDGTDYYSASAGAFYALANRKGYTVVANTGANLHFVRDDIADAFVPLNLEYVNQYPDHRKGDRALIDLNDFLC